MQVLHYNSETGVFTWVIPSRGTKAGDVAGCRKNNGYIKICVDQKQYHAHRLAFLYVEGRFPKADIDHVNGDRTDNRWANLRHATRSNNLLNKAKSPRNTSGFKGVSWHKQRQKWAARAQDGEKYRHLGLYDTPEAAAEAYRAFAMLRHGEFIHQSLTY